jgi:hypothetical protein
MGVNISGKGVFSGLANIAMGAVNNLNLLVTRIIGYTTVFGGGSSYYTTRVESTVDAVIGSSYQGYWKSLNKGKDWQTFPSDTFFTGIAYFNNKYYVTEPYNNNRFASASSFSGFSNDWSDVVLPNDNEYLVTGTNGDNLFTYSNNGITTLSCYKGKQDQTISPYGVKTKLWTTTDGISWSEEILPTTFSTRVMTNNGVTFYAETNFVNDDAVSKTILNKFQGTWYSQTVSLNIDFGSDGATNVFGNNLYVISNNAGSYSIIKYGPDCLEISTNAIQTFSEYGQTGPISGYFVDDNEQVVIISIITDGTDNHIYRTINYGQTWTKTATLSTTGAYQNFSAGFLRYIKSDNNLTLTTAGGNGENGVSGYSEDYGQTWQLGTVANNFSYYASPQEFSSLPVKTLVETQISIGNQGEEGAEVLAPVDIYTVPANTTTSIDEVTVKNNSANTITYDLGVLNVGVELTDINALINDQVIYAGATATVTNIDSALTAGQRIVVFPSAVDVVEVKVYGTES